MSDPLNERLNAILPRVVSDDFLSGSGIGNEIAFYIFDYPPEDELRVRDFIRVLRVNSRVVTHLLSVLSPAAHFEIGQVADLPFRDGADRVREVSEELVQTHQQDWDSTENSWSFQRFPLVDGDRCGCLETAFGKWVDDCESLIAKAQELEEEK